MVNGCLVFVTAYRNTDSARGRKNHQSSGANAPDKIIPARMDNAKLTIQGPQSFDRYLPLNHIVFEEHKYRKGQQVFLAKIDQN